MQWDDPFDVGGITTDYNLLVFLNGTYFGSKSGIDSTAATDEPIETYRLLAANTHHIQFVIALASSAPPTATHLRLVSVGAIRYPGPISLTTHRRCLAIRAR